MKQFLILFLFVLGTVHAQWQETVIFEVDGDPVTAGEFYAVYNKNRDIGQEIDPKTPAEYLELYLNFKLKVKEAESKGLDTLPSVTNEFNAYRNQLAKPYLMDKRTDERLVAEAYERSKTDIRASHIMVMVDENASPADTIKAFQKINKIRSELKKDNSNFAELARKYSDDEYSAKRDGDLGYFNVFDMVYQFENAAYQTNVNEVSKPVRSRFGYHIVMPTDKRIARGKARVAHIMTIANDKSTPEEKEKAKNRIMEVQKKLKSGEDFATLARQYSEDKNTSANGGELQMFGINDMVPAFEEAAFSMDRVGDVTEPVQTPYGWHIIKMLERTTLKTFEEAKAELAQKVQRDERSNLTRKAAIKKLKQDYNFTVNDKNLNHFIKGVPDNFQKDGYKVPAKLKDDPLFVLDGNIYGQQAFANHVSKNSRLFQGDSKEGIVQALFNNWVDQEVLAYENSKLEDKYPEFKYLVQEYRNGILLFELLEEEIWKPSMTDTVGLTAFFEKNRSKFTLPERAEAKVYTANNAKTAKKLVKVLKKGKDVDAFIEKAVSKDPLAVSNRKETIVQGMYSEVDAVWGKPTVVTLNEMEGLHTVIHISSINEARNKNLDECWGAVSAEYQKELESRWIERLRNTYKFRVFEENFSKVESKFNE